jgi:hypothetical protein
MEVEGCAPVDGAASSILRLIVTTADFVATRPAWPVAALAELAKLKDLKSFAQLDASLASRGTSTDWPPASSWKHTSARYWP